MSMKVRKWFSYGEGNLYFSLTDLIKVKYQDQQNYNVLDEYCHKNYYNLKNYEQVMKNDE